MNTIKLTFEGLDEEQADRVAALLSTENVQGFESENQTFFAYFAESDFDEEVVSEILLPFDFVYKKESIAPQNWNEMWEKNFEPIVVNNQVGVRAHFHPPFEGIQSDIEITPKMSFGTGHHATTQLMLQYACEIDFDGKSVFDFGCGTGVLAIFSSMKNASRVVGIDNDDWSVENAIENCERNRCSKVLISKDDIEQLEDTFDIILANINFNILIQYKSQLKNLLQPNGILIISGLLTSDKEPIMQQFMEEGFVMQSVKQQKEWIALEFAIERI